MIDLAEWVVGPSVAKTQYDAQYSGKGPNINGKLIAVQVQRLDNIQGNEAIILRLWNGAGMQFCDLTNFEGGSWSKMIMGHVFQVEDTENPVYYNYDYGGPVLVPIPLIGEVSCYMYCVNVGVLVRVRVVFER